jgi:hypothetical protein
MSTEMEVDTGDGARRVESGSLDPVSEDAEN